MLELIFPKNYHNLSLIYLENELPEHFRCEDKKLEAINSTNEMEKEGWLFENIETGKYYKRCKSDTWHGYSNSTEKPSFVRTIFKGRGLAEIKIGNCGFDNNGIVKVNLNQKEIGSLEKMTERYFNIPFSPNDTLIIIPVSKQPYGAIVNIFYLHVLCGRMIPISINRVKI